MRARVPGIEAPPARLRILFEDEHIWAVEGDTLAATLLDAGHLALRHASDGSERGVFCGMGACNECAVVVNGRPGQLACMVRVAEGLVVRRQQAFPDPAPVQLSPEKTREIAPTVLVVGGGPAGLSAAATIAESGVDVVLIDERAKLGGQFYKQPAETRRIDPQALDTQFSSGRQLIERVAEAGVEVLSGVAIWAAAPDLLYAHGIGHNWRIRPQRLILATGAIERGVPLPGWTLPGVVSTGAIQTLLRDSQVFPGGRILVSGNGPLNLQVASELSRAGAEVVGVVELADLRWHQNLLSGLGMATASPRLVKTGLSYMSTLRKAGVPVFYRASVTAIHGSRTVEQATVANVDSARTPIEGTERVFDVDAVALGYGFEPATEITRMLGCEHIVEPNTGSLVPVLSRSGRTSQERVWVVGDSARISGAYTAKAAGEIAALDVLDDLKVPTTASGAARRQLRRHRRFQRALAAAYGAVPLRTELARDTTIICRCESVQLADIKAAMDDGATSSGAVKRATRAGMGPCQGRYCGVTLTALVASTTGEQVAEFSGFAPQPPIRPMPLVTIASASTSNPDQPQE